MTSRKQPAVAFWATVVLVVALVAYPLSFGPACWACIRSKDSAVWEKVDSTYRPLIWMWNHTPLIGGTIMWYANVGTANGLYLGKSADERLYVRPL